MDSELVEEIQSGSKSAFEKLYQKYLSKIYHTVSRRVNSKHDTEDIVQEIFTSTFESIDRYDPKFNFSTWIYTITRNKVNDFLRKHYKFNENAIDVLEIQDIEGEEDIDLKESKDAQRTVSKLIELLPDKYKELLKMIYIERLKYRTIADKLDITVNNIKVRKNRAIKKLKEIIQK